MKRAALFLVLFIALGAAGGAGWWFLLRETPPEMAETVEESPESEAPADGAPYYVDVDPVTVPIIRDGRVVKHMSFVLVLQADSEDHLRVIYKSLPRLTDAYIRELHVLLSRRYVWDSGEVVPIARQRLMAASAQVVGPAVVEAVLVKGIQSRDPQPA